MVIKKNLFLNYCLKQLFCDKCDVEFIRDTIALTSYPQTNVYKCPKCGAIEHHKDIYPQISFITDEDNFVE